MSAKLERRDFIKVIAGSIAAWPLVAHAQQPAAPARSGNGGRPVL